MAAIETVEKALALAHARLSAAPEFEIFASTVAQLEYLLSVLRGNEKDRSRLKNMVLQTFLWVSSTLSRMVFKEGVRWKAWSCIGNCWV